MAAAMAPSATDNTAALTPVIPEFWTARGVADIPIDDPLEDIDSCMRLRTRRLPLLSSSWSGYSIHFDAARQAITEINETDAWVARRVEFGRLRMASTR